MVGVSLYPRLYGNMQKPVLLFRDARVNVGGNVKLRKKMKLSLLETAKKIQERVVLNCRNI